MANDRLISKGGLVRTLSVSDPSIQRKRLVVNASLLDLFILNGAFLYFALFVASTPLLVTVFLTMIPIMTVVTLLMYVFLKSVLGRSFYPVSIYSNGIEFPSFLFHRMIRRPAFLGREEIESGRTYGFSQGPRSGEMKDQLTLAFKTKNGKTYDTGARNRSEIEPTVEWIEKNWGIGIEMSTSPFLSAATPSVKTATKVRVANNFCAQCGRRSDEDLLFCPYCGTNFAPDTKQPSVESVWQASADPPNPYARSAPEPQPVHPQQYPPYGGPQPPVYPPQYPPYGGAHMTRPDGKNPKLAFILALLLGFMGFMGIGHLYMGKRLKGVALLLLGGFLAMLSLTAIFMLFEPSEYEMEVRIFTAALLSAPFLGLHLWQSFDAPKPDRKMPRNPF